MPSSILQCALQARASLSAEGLVLFILKTLAMLSIGGTSSRKTLFCSPQDETGEGQAEDGQEARMALWFRRFLRDRTILRSPMDERGEWRLVDSWQLGVTGSFPERRKTS